MDPYLAAPQCCAVCVLQRVLDSGSEGRLKSSSSPAYQAARPGICLLEGGVLYTPVNILFSVGSVMCEKARWVLFSACTKALKWLAEALAPLLRTGDPPRNAQEGQIASIRVSTRASARAFQTNTTHTMTEV